MVTPKAQHGKVTIDEVINIIILREICSGWVWMGTDF